MNPAPKLHNPTPILFLFTPKIKTPTPVFTPVTRSSFANFTITILSKLLAAYVKFHATPDPNTLDSNSPNPNFPDSNPPTPIPPIPTPLPQSFQPQLTKPRLPPPQLPPPNFPDHITSSTPTSLTTTSSTPTPPCDIWALLRCSWQPCQLCVTMAGVATICFHSSLDVNEGARANLAIKHINSYQTITDTWTGQVYYMASSAGY